MTHLLVTNDYPPKLGGIQSYLYELWRRIPSDRFVVLTTEHADSANFDAAAPHRIVRANQSVLLPTKGLRERIRALANEIDASLVVLDPAVPVGLVGPHLGLPYAVVLHGAEVTVPGHLPAARRALRRVISHADLVIAAGAYPEREARRVAGRQMPPTVVVPPGVDAVRFQPLSPTVRSQARDQFGLAPQARVVLSVSRLVPRKGMDVLIEAAGRLRNDHPDLQVVIAGTGRDEKRLSKLIEQHRAPVRLLGAISEEDLALLYGASDVFVMLARNRWLGLEQEGFGIVFLEAGASGVPAIAGRSGGTTDAVVDGETGLVVDRPADIVVATAALRTLLNNAELCGELGTKARARILEQHDYDMLASELDRALGSVGG